MGNALAILPISVGDSACNESASGFSRNKCSMFPELALVLSDTKHIKNVKGSFSHFVG